MPHYEKPGWFTAHVSNNIVAGLTRLGLSLKGSRVLKVRGRKTGQWHSTPVNLLTLGDERYLVTPRGETQWVRNLRVAGRGELSLGRRTDPFTALELTEAEKPQILREYLKRWKTKTSIFFEGTGPDSPEEELRRISPEHPVFRITARCG
jgi:deazaflavin-dependent oxidoreductase (nitroreductase family)